MQINMIEITMPPRRFTREQMRQMSELAGRIERLERSHRHVLELARTSPSGQMTVHVPEVAYHIEDLTTPCLNVAVQLAQQIAKLRADMLEKFGVEVVS